MEKLRKFKANGFKSCDHLPLPNMDQPNFGNTFNFTINHSLVSPEKKPETLAKRVDTHNKDGNLAIQ